MSEEHIVHIPVHKLSQLRKWLERPNGSFRVSPRMVFEAVEGGSAWVKTSPFGYEAESNETN